MKNIGVGVDNSSCGGETVWIAFNNYKNNTKVGIIIHTTRIEN